MSVIVDQKTTLDLVFPDEDTFKIWVTGVQIFINNCFYKNEGLVTARLQFYKNIWAEVDDNIDRKLDIDEIGLLLNKMNIEIKDNYLKELFNKFDTNKNGSIDFEEFVKMMDFMRKRDEIKEVFDKYKNTESGMIHSLELLRFMKEIQKEKNITEEEC